MASRVTPEIRRLLRERKILRIKPDRELVLKEIKGAEAVKEFIEKLE